MAGDFSRSSLNPGKKYTGVLMQQGRVQVDADWNEQLLLQLHRARAEAQDLMGACGTPKSGDGFKISQLAGVNDLVIHPGRFYVDGLLCELDPEWIPCVAATAAGSGSTQINLPALNIDGRTLVAGDWVELFATGNQPLTAQVTWIGTSTAATSPNLITPSFFPVSLSSALGPLATASALWLKRTATLTTQPFLVDQWDAAMAISPPNGGSGDTLNLPDGDYLVVLDAWLREVNALTDAHLREVALGGPDTSERLQTAWQVHLIPYGGESSPPASPLASPPAQPLDCCSSFPGWDQFAAAATTTGRMNAQAPPPGNTLSPCLLPPSAGYLGLANQLYRVEIFQPGTAEAGATFVWSRDNAMVETPIRCIDTQNNVYVSSLGTDDLHSFSQGDWVEIVSPQGESLGRPRFLAQINQAPAMSSNPPCGGGSGPAYRVTLTPTPPAYLQSAGMLRLRRWDMPQNQAMWADAYGNPQGMQIVPGWLPLENNIQVSFSSGNYASGSYWEIPARTATGDIEWPPFNVPNVNPIPQPPMGGQHAYCRLALLNVTQGAWTVTDCRATFPSLTCIAAKDICYDPPNCELAPANTVQKALDALDAKARLHNRMLHGAGVVCGLAVHCAGEKGSGTRVTVETGYAIDCEGYDLTLERTATVDLAQLVTSADPEGLRDGDYQLILERSDAAAMSGGEQKVDVPFEEDSGGGCCGCKGANAETQPNVCVSFRAIPCKQDTFVHQWLDGSLLMDFYDHCIKTLIDRFNTQYGGKFDSSENQVTQQQALLSSLTNLLIQLIQPSLTKDVYLSRPEYVYLRDFYGWLRDALRDPTFCSLLDGARKFPEYTLGDAPIQTLFGKGLKTRLRVDPTGERGYAVGAQASILVYDLQSGQLAQVVTLPIPGDAASWTTRDVAFSADGTQVFAIATGTNSNSKQADSLFAAGTVDGCNVNWNIAGGSLGPLAMLTLATVAPVPGANFPTLYGAVAGQGIYSITFGAGAALAATQQASCNAVGHLIGHQGYLIATVNSGTAGSGRFDQINSYSIASWTNPVTYPLGGSTGDLADDIALMTYMLGPYVETALVASGSNSSSPHKQLLLFSYSTVDQNLPQGENQNVPAASGPPVTYDLGVNTTIRLVNNPTLKSLMIASESDCRLRTLAVSNAALAVTPYAPVEVHPVSIVFASQANGAGRVYVLNSTSNTINALPGDMPAFSEDAKLEAWRVAALEAFIDLFMALLQNLKDCFCELLLPACPACDAESPLGKGVSLGCVTVKDGGVYKICSLETRKIVKTFSTVGYWMSVLPLVPLLKTLVSDLCCLVLPELTSSYAAPQSDSTSLLGGLSTTSGETFRGVFAQASTFKAVDLGSVMLQQAKPASGFLLDAATSYFKPAAAASGFQVGQLSGMSLAAAQSSLAAAKVEVSTTQAYDPTALTSNLAAYSTAPPSIAAGSSVSLVVDANQQVRYAIPTPPAMDALQAAVRSSQNDLQNQVAGVVERLSTDETRLEPATQNIQSLQNLVTSLQSSITTLQSSQATELASRDQQIAQLTSQTKDLAAQLAGFQDLAATVKELQTRLPPPAQAGKA